MASGQALRGTLGLVRIERGIILAIMIDTNKPVGWSYFVSKQQLFDVELDCRQNEIFEYIIHGLSGPTC